MKRIIIKFGGVDLGWRFHDRLSGWRQGPYRVKGANFIVILFLAAASLAFAQSTQTYLVVTPPMKGELSEDRLSS